LAVEAGAGEAVVAVALVRAGGVEARGVLVAAVG